MEPQHQERLDRMKEAFVLKGRGGRGRRIPRPPSAPPILALRLPFQPRLFLLCCAFHVHVVHFMPSFPPRCLNSSTSSLPRPLSISSSSSSSISPTSPSTSRPSITSLPALGCTQAVHAILHRAVPCSSLPPHTSTTTSSCPGFLLLEEINPPPSTSPEWCLPLSV